MRRLFPILLLAIPLGACLPAPSDHAAPVDRNLITLQEIAAAEATDAWECVEHLRPHWLRTRGPRSISDPMAAFADVFVDDQHRGKVDVLKQIVISDVEELRFLPPGPAAVRYGMGFPRGVIVVTRKGR